MNENDFGIVAKPLRAPTQWEMTTLAEHAQWFASSGQEGRQADLSNHDFSFTDLSGHNLDNFIEAKCVGTSFLGANLIGADFTSADVTDADFRDSSIWLASFRGAKRGGAKFKGALLQPTQSEPST